ncbi:MAG: hypothetical protein CM15mP18_4500 [Methanobacteriota archaeon]|nr:MAG: hypothetical protein CM15mP18_4500 [Euryarchaeota archaeon]
MTEGVPDVVGSSRAEAVTYRAPFVGDGTFDEGG